MEFGDSLNPYAGLEFFTGRSPEEIKSQLDQIRIPFKIIAMYAAGTTHIAWVDLGGHKIRKVNKKSS